MKRLLASMALFAATAYAGSAFAGTTITSAGWTPNTTTGVNEYQAFKLTLNTSNPLNTASVTASNSYVKSGSSCSGGTTFGSVTLSDTSGTPTSSITFTPTAAYTSGQQYTLCVIGGGSGIKDTKNGTMGTNASFTFTVRDYAPPYVSLYVPNVPVVSSTTPNIAITFDEGMNQSTVNTGSVTLLDVTDNIYVPLIGPTWSGNVATFRPAAPIPSLKTYQVALDGTQKDPAGNPIDCSGHVCSWSFTADNTPPTVTAYTPNSPYVTTNYPLVSATFSQLIDTATLTTSSFSLKKGGTSVGGSIGYDAGTNTATFNPSAALADGAYTAALTTAIKDTASPTPNPLAQAYTWSFTVDATPPAVAGVSPASGAAGASVSTPIVINFTEANGMLATSMNGSTVTVSDGVSNIPCTISYDAANKRLTLTPANLLAYNTTYTVTLSSDITDLAGNPLSGVSWSFTTQAVAPNVYTVYPPFMCSSVNPNVLIILDNSNSMDEDMNNNAIGSPHCSTPSDPNTCSKSILARLALSNIVNTYGNLMRVGIMSYKLPAISKYNLHNSFYFNSYDPRTYCPNPPAACNNYCVQEDPKSGSYTPSANESACNAACQAENPLFQANYRDAITTSAGTSGSNGTPINRAKRQTYCSLIYPKANKYTDPNNVTVYYGMPGTLYDTANDGRKYVYSSSYSSTEYPSQTDSYYICGNKTGATDATTGYSSCTGPYGFVPTDDDYALGFYDFGPRNYWYYTSQTWFANTSPGGGYLNVPLADNVAPANGQINSLLTVLGGNRTPPAFQNDETGYMSCTSTTNPNACSYIINAGLTPTAGTLQSATNYFNGSLVQGSTVASPIQYPCQKNFIIYVTDGSPSVTETGTAGSASTLMPTVISKIDGLRCPPSATSANCKVSYNGTPYDVETYVLGVGLGAADQANVDAMAVHGGTAVNGHAFYANNPTDLNNALISIFNSIIAQVSSGTAASILNNSQGSGSNLLQAVFYPTKTFDNDTKLNWIGEMQNLWYYIDPMLQNTSVREDTNQDNILNLTQDKIVQFYFDTTQNKTLVKRFSDNNGDGLADSSTPDDTVIPDQVQSLWKAGQLLWKRNVSTDPRSVYTTIGGGMLKFSPTPTDGFVTSSTAWDLMQIPAGTDPQRQAKATTLVNYMLGTDQPADTDGTLYRPRRVTMNNCGVTDSEGCTREWKLGDIVSSTPRLVSNLPLGTYDLRPSGGYGDASYAAFLKTANYKTRGMVFVGANDGMLHAFRLGTLQELNGKYTKAQITDYSGSTATSATRLGREEWAFIPRNALPYLKYYSDMSYDHIFYVDRTPTIVDASIGSAGCTGDYSTCQKVSDGSTWRTVLIGGMGYGGASRPSTGSCNSVVNGIPNCIESPLASAGLSSYFALDVTDPENPQYLWEFSGDATGTLGASTTGPAIVRVAKRDVNGNPDQTRNGKWYAVFASGPTGPIDTKAHQFLGQSDQELKIFVVDLATGNLVQTFSTGLQNAFAGSLTSGVIDTDRWDPTAKGYYSDDVVYIGYTQLDPVTGTWTKGGVLRLTTSDQDDPTSTDPAKKWTLSTLISGTGPVTTSITKLQDRGNNNLWLYFGTGRFYYKGDDPSTTVQQRLFGVKEPCYSTANRTMASPIPGGTLNHMDKSCTDQVAGTLVDQSGSVTTAPQATLPGSAGGWFITLDASDSSHLSERVITDPVATSSGAVFFTTFKPSSDACKFGGDSLIWALRYDTGAIPPSKAMQGKGLIQVSTGAFQEISLATAFKNTGNARLDGRRLASTISGVPPTSQGLSLVVNPKPVKKILHIREK